MLHLFQAKSFLPANPLSDMYVCFFRELFKTVSVTDEDMARVLSKFKFINSKRQPKNPKRILCSNTINTSIKTVSKCRDTMQHVSVFKPRQLDCLQERTILHEFGQVTSIQKFNIYHQAKIKNTYVSPYATDPIKPNRLNYLFTTLNEEFFKRNLILPNFVFRRPTLFYNHFLALIINVGKILALRLVALPSSDFTQKNLSQISDLSLSFFSNI